MISEEKRSSRTSATLLEYYKICETGCLTESIGEVKRPKNCYQPYNWHEKPSSFG